MSKDILKYKTECILAQPQNKNGFQSNTTDQKPSAHYGKCVAPGLHTKRAPASQGGFSFLLVK